MSLPEHPHHDHGPQRPTDPVCGMTVDAATATQRLQQGEQTYLFCSRRCRDKFAADPGKYRRPEGAAAAVPHRHHGHDASPAPAATGGVLWTCPMHPQIVRTEPGACPICGMGLEPMTPTGAEAVNPELSEMTRRFWVGLALSAPLLLLVTAAHVSDHPLGGLLSPRASVWVQLVLATPVVLWGGWPFFARGWQSLVNRNLNMFTLIAIGTGVAYGYSIAATLVPGIFPASFRGADGEVEVYFEAAAVITTLVLLGQVLELRARSADQQRHPRAPRSRAEDDADLARRRQRGGYPAGASPARRSPARPSRREGPGGRDRARGAQRRR